MGTKLGPRTRCFCGNFLQDIYLAKAGGNKEPIGKFCVHCDDVRDEEAWFLELKKEKIAKTEEKNKYKNINTTKELCPYCHKSKHSQKIDNTTYITSPIYNKTTGKTTYYKRKYSITTKFSCKNPKCKSETHEGIWKTSKFVT